MKTIAILLALALMSGCVALSQPMVNAEGKTYKCEAAGFGVIGTVATLAMQQHCISKAKDAGYKEVN